MTELFGLGCERAGPAFSEPSIQHASGASGHRKREAAPFDGRIAPRLTLIEQVAILDKQ